MLFRMKHTLRVVFAGTPENAASILEKLQLSGVHIVGVLTRKDSLVGRSKDLRSSAVAEKALQLGLEVFKANTIDDLAQNWLRGLNADIGAVVAYGTIFGNDTLGIPRLGWLNLHYSLLPELRGPAPVQHALLLGKLETGVSVFRLNEGIDTGPVVAQETVAIDEMDSASSLLEKLTVVGSSLLADVIERGEDAVRGAREQLLTGKETSASKPTRELAKLNFASDATSQFNKVRAMNPEPVAWFEYNELPVRVIRARASKDSSVEMSVAQIIDKELVVGCQSGALVLETVQPAGKNEMSGSDWFRGLRVEKLKFS